MYKISTFKMQLYYQLTKTSKLNRNILFKYFETQIKLMNQEHALATSKKPSNTQPLKNSKTILLCQNQTHEHLLNIPTTLRTSKQD